MAVTRSLQGLTENPFVESALVKRATGQLQACVVKRTYVFRPGVDNSGRRRAVPIGICAANVSPTPPEICVNPDHLLQPMLGFVMTLTRIGKRLQQAS